jgi:peptide/nickel transport system substrate-binding protein
VKFHDGTTLTSADVKATYERLRNPPPGVVSLRLAQFRDIAAIETPDEGTIVFRLAQPNSTMLTVFASPWNCLYSARRLAADPNFPVRNIMGTGPFRFVEHVAGAEWRGARFDGYFRAGLPYLDGYLVINLDPPALTNALIAGRIQTDFRGLNKADADRVIAERGNAMRLYESEAPGLLMLVFNSQKPPFNDARVRRAMSLAIDRWGGSAAIGRLNLFSQVGGFQRIDTPYGRSKAELEKLPGYRPDMAANRAEARRLLAEAGVPEIKAVFTNRPQYSALGVFLIDQWRQIGVTVTQDQPANPIYASSRQTGNFDMIGDVLPDYVDEPSIQLANTISFDINPNNTSRAIDRVIDTLFDKQLRAIDAMERKQIVGQLEERLLTEANMVPLYWAKRIIVMASEVRGFQMTPSALVGQDLSEIWIAAK